MGMRHLFAAALGASLLVMVLAAPVPAVTPSPAPSANPTLAPIDDSSTPNPSASGSLGPKVIGHIYTSAFCANFVDHFNAATRVVIDNDRNLDAVDLNLHRINSDWNRRDGAMRVYDERVQLIATVSNMLKSIPVSQAAVNELLAQAKATADPERKAALLDSASQLQRTIDRQRAVAYDLTSIIHVLLDKHTQEDTGEAQIQSVLLPGYTEHVHLNDDPVPQPGTDTLTDSGSNPTPAPSASPRAVDVEYVLQWTRQRSIIGNAESKAAVAADHVVRICNSEQPPTAPPRLYAPSPSP